MPYSLFSKGEGTDPLLKGDFDVEAFICLKRLQHRYFSVHLTKFLRTSFYRAPLDDCCEYTVLEIQFLTVNCTAATRIRTNFEQLFILIQGIYYKS